MCACVRVRVRVRVRVPVGMRVRVRVRKDLRVHLYSGLVFVRVRSSGVTVPINSAHAVLGSIGAPFCDPKFPAKNKFLAHRSQAILI